MSFVQDKLVLGLVLEPLAFALNPELARGWGDHEMGHCP